MYSKLSQNKTFFISSAFLSYKGHRIGGKREFPHFDDIIMFSNSVTKQMEKMEKLYISTKSKLKTETLKALIGSH